MRDLSRATGISIEELKHYKKNNADGFRSNGKINWLKLQSWLDDPENEDIRLSINDDKYLQFRGLKMEAEAGLSQIALDTAKGLIVNREDICAKMLQVASSQKAFLKSKLCNELPSKLLGADVPTMSVELAKVVDELYLMMASIKV